LLACLYQNEIEVRKLLADTVKKLLEICKSNDFERISLHLKGLENSVVEAMMAKIVSF
jgi:hypothetical protein